MNKPKYIALGGPRVITDAFNRYPEGIAVLLELQEDGSYKHVAEFGEHRALAAKVADLLNHEDSQPSDPVSLDRRAA